MKSKFKIGDHVKLIKGVCDPNFVRLTNLKEDLVYTIKDLLTLKCSCGNKDISIDIGTLFPKDTDFSCHGCGKVLPKPKTMMFNPDYFELVKQNVEHYEIE